MDGDNNGRQDGKKTKGKRNEKTDRKENDK